MNICRNFTIFRESSSFKKFCLRCFEKNVFWQVIITSRKNVLKLFITSTSTGFITYSPDRCGDLAARKPGARGGASSCRCAPPRLLLFRRRLRNEMRSWTLQLQQSIGSELQNVYGYEFCSYDSLARKCVLRQYRNSQQLKRLVSSGDPTSFSAASMPMF